MSYRPARVHFMPPWTARLPSVLFFGLAIVIGLVVAAARVMAHDSWLYQEIVVGDRHRTLSSQVFAALLFCSAFAAMARQQMAGVVVQPDGIEAREILPFGIPRFRRFTWIQIDRVGIPTAGKLDAKPSPSSIRIDLWNGRHVFLPDVEKRLDLALMIERVALARAIPIEGGTGIVDELGSPFDDD